MQLYRRHVKDVMSKDVVTVDAAATVHTALELMVENHISALPVIDHAGRCVGILSTSDFVDMTYNMDEGLNEFEPQGEIWWELFVSRVSQRVGQQSVMDLMAEEIASVGPDEPLVQAARKMLRERIHHLPVLDAEQRLVGIVTMTDILRAFVQSSPRSPG